MENLNRNFIDLVFSNISEVQVGNGQIALFWTREAVPERAWLWMCVPMIHIDSRRVWFQYLVYAHFAILSRVQNTAIFLSPVKVFIIA